MAGLLGVLDGRSAEDAAQRFAVARDRMLRHGRLTVTPGSALGGRYLFGSVQLARKDQRPPGGQASTAIFHGVLYNAAALRQNLRGSRSLDSVDDLIAALYREDGPDFVSRLTGEFCLALVDPEREMVLIATDTLGLYPLYWRADANGLIFSSDLSAIIKATPAATRLDLRAVADYMTIGAVFGPKTLVEGIQLLDPGTVLTYQARGGATSQHKYVRVEEFFESKATDKTKYMDALRPAFKEAVRRASTTSIPIGLSLSGGLDSRAILSAVDTASVHLKTYTLGVDGCADQAIAKRLASLAGTEHYYFELSDAYLRDFLPNMAQMVSITDGMYLSHGLTEMLAIQFLDKTGIGVLMRGHGGELAKAHLAWPLHTDPQVHAMTSIGQLVPYLSARANYITPGLPLSGFLTPDAAARAGRGTPDTFGTMLEGLNLTPAECCSYLYLRELNRRFTVPSLELFRTNVEVRLPYLDVDFLRLLLAAPAAWRDSTEIHGWLTAGGRRDLLKVRNSNTGAPADAGPMTEFVLDKFNTVLKRLNVRGYRHYHNFDAWMRRMLLEAVEAELLSPGARVQGFVDRAALARLLQESRDGSANRSYLLQILLILELWQRENGVQAG